MDLYYEIHETIRRGWSWERIGGDLGVSADRAADIYRQLSADVSLTINRLERYN